MRGPTSREKLSPSLHYMLTLLSRVPRFYSVSVGEILWLQRRGYPMLTGGAASDGSQEWAITDAGRTAVQAYARNDAALPARPTFSFCDRKTL